ncbi:MAG: hypothetical protein FWD97_06785 [Defluviitaleaceae bacterium]|nr:hypothetical protein [Defluviitaleaceae bacterium]
MKKIKKFISASFLVAVTVMLLLIPSYHTTHASSYEPTEPFHYKENEGTDD